MHAVVPRNAAISASNLHVYVLSAVEAGGAAWSDAIGSESLDRALFERFVGDEVVEVVGGEVGDGAAVGEFGARPCGSVADRITSQNRKQKKLTQSSQFAIT